jgi:cytochrome c oxidase subunit 1
MYALEIGGRRRGGTGLVGWFFRVPWSDPALSAQILAMLAFMLGGITGLINASYNINQVIHNTAFVPGHFHLTVGTAVTLSFMGIACWLIPFLTGRALWSPGLARWQSWIYFVGVLIFARGMISGGLKGMPRRTELLIAPCHKESWELAGRLAGVGGTLMFVGAVLFFVVILGTVWLGRPAPDQEIPFTATIQPPAESGWELRLDRFRYWVAITLVLIALAYGPFLVMHLPPRLISAGFKGY